MRNSIYGNSILTARNKINSNAYQKHINSTAIKKSKYKKIFKNNNEPLSSKRSKEINSRIDMRKSFFKKQGIKSYKNIFKKIKLFHDKINESNTLDIKSYETTLDIPSISENQEKKLSLLSSSLLILTQKDELLYNNNNYEDKLESSIDFILNYLSIKDLFNLALINKEYFKIILKYFLEKTEAKIIKIKEKINEILIKSKGFINTKEKEFQIFKKDIFNERAMNLINLISKKKLFKENSSLMHNKDIILLFDLFFICIGKKNEIMKYDTYDTDTKIKRWNYFCNYFNSNENKYLNNIIEKSLLNGKFSDEKINALYERSIKYIDKLKPNHFQIINKDIAIFAYVIKDLLFYFGINKENKINYQKLYTLYNIRLNVNEKIADKFNKMLVKYD